MRKSSLLIGALSSTAIQAEAGVGLQEFHGRAALLTDMTDADGYTVMSCAQVEGARCAGQCAEVWCDSNRIGDCASGSRLVVQVADRCATCERGDLFLSRDNLQQLLGANTHMYLFSVRWRCVECGTTEGSRFDNNEQVVGKTMRPGPEGRVHKSPIVTAQVADQPINDEALHCPLSDQNIAGSSDTEVDILPVNNNERSKGNGTSDNNSGGELSYGFGSTSGDVWRANIPREKTVLPMSTRLSSSKSTNDVSTPSPPVPSTIISTSGSSAFDGESLSSGSGSSLSSSAANEDPSYPVQTTPFDNLQDARATSSTLSGITPNKNQSPIFTTVSPDQMPDDSVDKNLSATSSVTKSPFFYASIMLGIVGLIGATVGYLAKQKRSYRDERRAFRMATQTGTHACNSRPDPSSMAALASRTQSSSHSIVIL